MYKALFGLEMLRYLAFAVVADTITIEARCATIATTFIAIV
jgi:hypothetical protein